MDVSDAEAREEVPVRANGNCTHLRQPRQDRQLKEAFLALARGCASSSFICPFTLHLAELKHDRAFLRVRKPRGGAPVAQCKLGSLRSGAQNMISQPDPATEAIRDVRDRDTSADARLLLKLTRDDLDGLAALAFA